MTIRLAVPLLVLLSGTGALAQGKQGGPDGPGSTLRGTGQTPAEVRKENRDIRNEERYENRRIEQDGTGWTTRRR